MNLERLFVICANFIYLLLFAFVVYMMAPLWPLRPLAWPFAAVLAALALGLLAYLVKLTFAAFARP